MLTDEGLELLDEGECRRRLASGRLGRVGVSIGSLPAILPVDYRMVGDAIVFRTGPGAKLNAAVNGQVVAFEVEGGLDPVYREGWSVLVVGKAEEVRDPAELADLADLALLPQPWADGPRPHVVRIPVEFVSGRRIHHHEAGQHRR